MLGFDMRSLIILSIVIFIASCNSVKHPSMSLGVEINQDEFSYLLYDLDNSEIVSSYNEDKLLIPASVFKIMPAYAALEIFGHSKRFSTKIYYSGEVKDGILNGDLIISGGGDPSIEYQDLFNMASLVRSKGISNVNGNLVYEDELLIAAPEINNTQPIAAYNPGLSSLMLRKNSFLLNSKERDFLMVPELSYMNFNAADGAEDIDYDTRHSWVVGKDKSYRLPIKDSSFFVANVFSKILEYNNIGVLGVKRGNNLLNKKLLLEYKSSSLVDIIRYNLNYSHNLTSEILLLQIARTLECENNNLLEAAGCLKRWYDDHFPQLKWNYMHWENGSGLSINTNLTALHMMEVIRSLYLKKYGNETGVSLFPISGLTGTLKNKFLEDSLHIWAKTGSMYFVSGLAGFIFSKEHRYVFIILANDTQKRRELDGVDKKVQINRYEELIEHSKLWKDEIYKKQRELIKMWLDN